jgi:hypothetical protein
MAYGPESTNPRERRAYAESLVLDLRAGKGDYAETLTAVVAARATEKGQRSGLAQALGKTAGLFVIGRVEHEGNMFLSGSVVDVRDVPGAYELSSEEQYHQLADKPDLLSLRLARP